MGRQKTAKVAPEQVLNRRLVSQSLNEQNTTSQLQRQTLQIDFADEDQDTFEMIEN